MRTDIYGMIEEQVTGSQEALSRRVQELEGGELILRDILEGAMERIKELEAENETLLSALHDSQLATARWREQSRNHAETLRGIAKMDPLTEGGRMVLWAKDGLAGYAESAEATLKNAYDERNALAAELATAQAQTEAARKEAEDVRKAAVEVIAREMNEAYENAFRANEGDIEHFRVKAVTALNTAIERQKEGE